jgi:hypothetical protein
MSEPAPNQRRPIESRESQIATPGNAPAAAPNAAAPGDPAPPAAALTPEEQMERFAKDLKENDWGHQPC